MATHQKWNRELDKFEKEMQDDFQKFILESYLGKNNSKERDSNTETFLITKEDVDDNISKVQKEAERSDNEIQNDLTKSNDAQITDGENFIIEDGQNEGVQNDELEFSAVQNIRIKKIMDMGFSKSDAITALEMNQNDIVNVWLK